MSDNSIKNNNPIRIDNKNDTNINSNIKQAKDIEDIPLFDKIIDDNLIINLAKSLENLGFSNSR